MTLLVIILVLLLVLILLDYWKKSRLVLATKHLDGPFAWPIIGSALLFKCNNDGK